MMAMQVREEAGELCQTWEAGEGRERAVAEMADLLYHAMVLLRLQGVSMAEVMEALHKREALLKRCQQACVGTDGGPYDNAD